MRLAARVLVTGRAFGSLLPMALALSFLTPPTTSTAADFKAEAIADGQVIDLAKSPSGLVSVIVKYDADSLAAYKGDLKGLPATNPETTGALRLDPATAAYKAYESFLIGKERTFESALRAQVSGARIVHRYRTILGGASVIVPRDHVADLASLPGVKAVYPDQLLSIDTDRSPEFIGAPALWANVGGQAHAGENIIIGMVDSGIWPEHPSVADTGYPAVPSRWHGTACQFTGGANPGDPFTCNKKLIGAARFLATFDALGPAPLAGEFTTARDNNGHGSHTMTTAGGNADVLATTGTLVSGIAPRARMAAYKVCFTVASGSASCYTSDSVAAIEQAILDGVDVINFSISGGTSPYGDAVSLAFLDAFAANVFVACSAGNSGPAAETVAHREPWTTSVAATTTDKGFLGSSDLTADGGATLTVTGQSSTASVGPAPIVLSSAAPYSDDLCINPAAPGTFTGKIVACKRGTNARVAKGSNVLAGGAVGMILYNPSPGTLNADVHALPTLHIDDTQGALLVPFITGHTNPMASIVGGAFDLTGQGDVTADFSSRGGPLQTLGISKPDVGAPGVNILAANTPSLAAPGLVQGTYFQIISGTSMASPHVAGAAALLRQLHFEWRPAQIKSALMLTATTADTVKEDGVTPTTPFDVGSGRIDLGAAAQVALVMNETAPNYITLQNNLERANYPSLYVPIMPGKVSVKRTLKSYYSKSTEWKLSVVAPPDLVVNVAKSLNFKGKESLTDMNIDIDASAVPVGQVRHAVVQLKGKTQTLTFPITIVRKNGALVLAKVCDATEIDLGDVMNCTIDATNNAFTDASVAITDVMPKQLKLGAVTGATASDTKALKFTGVLGGQTAPIVSVGDGVTPAGYLALSLFGVSPIGGMGDETIVNFNVPSFQFGGVTYTRVGVVSNGYLVLGGGTSTDVQFVNQSLPNTNPPNNVLAPYWTDLNVAAGGAVRIATLTDGVTTWLVVDWAAVKEYTDGVANSFEVWIQLGATEDVSFAYGATGNGDGGFLTVGAENFLGTSGGNYYYNGTGTLPTTTTEISVTTAPGTPGETHTITYQAKGKKPGVYNNCAELTSSAMFGTATSCYGGEVVVP